MGRNHGLVKTFGYLYFSLRGCLPCRYAMDLFQEESKHIRIHEWSDTCSISFPQLRDHPHRDHIP